MRVVGRVRSHLGRIMLPLRHRAQAPQMGVGQSPGRQRGRCAAGARYGDGPRRASEICARTSSIVVRSSSM
jgi:hypothetical protein